MPLTEKQLDYLRHCSHRWNVKTGATGSGKSFLDFTVTIPKRLQAARGEGLLVLLGNTRGTLERNILEPMRQWWPGYVGYVRGDNTVELFGKRVYALGADNKKHVARIQGATFEYVYGDEVTTWSEEVFQMLKSRLRCAHSHFDGTCNPDNPQHWFKRFLDSDADIYQQSYTIDDGVLPPQVVAELKKEYAGTVYYDRYILGRWAQAEGLIYPFGEENLVDDLPPGGEYYISCDYGTRNPFSAGLWCWDGKTATRIREYYYSGRESRQNKTDEEYYTELERLAGDLPIRAVIVDPSAAWRSSGGTGATRCARRSTTWPPASPRWPGISGTGPSASTKTAGIPFGSSGCTAGMRAPWRTGPAKSMTTPWMTSATLS